MREVPVSQVSETVARLCIEANKKLPADVETRIRWGCVAERSPLGKTIMDDLLCNLDAAREMDIPICQDTGMAVVFLEIGQEVHFTGGRITDAVNIGVAKGYTDGLLRCSVVSDPLKRVNTGNNTPAVIHMTLTEGDQVKVTVAPKGFGSENMSGMKMLTPAASRQDVITSVAEIVQRAGGNSCPPMVLGGGLGGDFELCALLAKRALCRSLDSRHPDEDYALLEEEMLEAVNQTGIGPQGFGGTVTALKVNVETFATHIAGLPLAVNIGCHVTRHASAIV